MSGEQCWCMRVLGLAYDAAGGGVWIMQYCIIMVVAGGVSYV